jgi:hypothetical protein
MYEERLESVPTELVFIGVARFARELTMADTTE